MARVRSNEKGRLDDAARAAWLYYVAQKNQDEIAAQMGISRQSAQRLVALALQRRLIKFRLDHPIAHCLDLAEALKQQFGLDFCEVTLADPTSDDPALGIAEAAAVEMENYLSRTEPLVMALGTGREIRGAVEQLPQLHCPQHKVVTLVGNLAPDGSASFNDVIMRMGDAIQGPHYPMAVPVYATSREERDTLCAQKPIQSNIRLAQSADIAFVGIGEVGMQAPILSDGFVTSAEMQELLYDGAHGEIAGWVFDADGKLLDTEINNRVASVPLTQPPAFPIIGVARGTKKLAAIRAALKGEWLAGLVTDEATASLLIKKLD
jgi:DNA-binding transcriptional regulator LsrR (DeoR family)